MGHRPPLQIGDRVVIDPPKDQVGLHCVSGLCRGRAGLIDSIHRAEMFDNNWVAVVRLDSPFMVEIGLSKKIKNIFVATQVKLDHLTLEKDYHGEN